MLTKILIINGPNLNFLGKRNKNIYGIASLKDIELYLQKKIADLNIEINFVQENHEGAIIDLIHNANEYYDAIIINAGGYSHNSVAIHDALEICALPKIEVHLSNILNREEFRKNSIISRVCNGSIIGMGKLGYFLAAIAAKEIIDSR